MFTSRTQAPRLQRFGFCLDPCFIPEDLKQCLVSNRCTINISINELKQHLPSWHRNRDCPCAYLRWSLHKSKFSLLPACLVRFHVFSKPLLVTACICPLLMEHSNLCMTMLHGLLELKSSLSSPTLSSIRTPLYIKTWVVWNCWFCFCPLLLTTHSKPFFIPKLRAC